MPTSAASSSSFGVTTIATTAPTTATFSEALDELEHARLPKMFFAPVSGLSFFGSGLIALHDGFHLTCATLAMTPATRHGAGDRADGQRDDDAELAEQRAEAVHARRRSASRSS